MHKISASGWTIIREVVNYLYNVLCEDGTLSRESYAVRVLKQVPKGCIKLVQKNKASCVGFLIIIAFAPQTAKEIKPAKQLRTNATGHQDGGGTHPEHRKQAF